MPNSEYGVVLEGDGNLVDFKETLAETGVSWQ